MDWRISSLTVVYTELARYLSHERRLVPMILGTKTPFANKHEAQDRRVLVSDADQLEAWLSLHPRCNWALLGMVQLDADSEEAMAWIRDIGIRRSDAIWILRTRRGFKPIFRAPADCPRTHNDPQHTVPDLGGPKTLLVIPPSVHPSGFAYSWVRGHSPRDIPFEQLPEPPLAVLEYWRQIALPPVQPREHQGTPGYLDAIYNAIVAKLQAEGLRLRPTRNGGLQGDCPFHQSRGRKAFVIHPQRGAWCFAGCLQNGRLTSLALRLGIREVR